MPGFMRFCGRCKAIGSRSKKRSSYNLQRGVLPLWEMQKDEYEAMCRAMEAEIEHPGLSTEEFRREQKRLRSAVLHRMQRLGVDTSDWDVVDAFCLSNRIARKEFARLSLAELRVMVSKLEAMGRKGYSRPRRTMLPVIVKTNQLPS